MHSIEPYFNWRHLYQAEEDERSFFYGKEHSEFEYTNQIYNFVLHPQWDDFGSETLFLKILFVDYDEGYCIIEMIGEWNDALTNDIMLLKRDIAEDLMYFGVNKFILIGENVLNFHGSDDCYYEEWFEDAGSDGWVIMLNFRDHVLDEFKRYGNDYYFLNGGEFNDFNWRRFSPGQLFGNVSKVVQKRLEI
ncbi:MAG: hypothetical protein IAF38_01855 [Bacteroidia bacterium]|nr:hypothetical protein [Bacteroidia bacterium]